MSGLTWDYEAFGEHVLNADWMVAHMRDRAEAMKEFAEAIAPYEVMDRDGNHYRDGFRVEANAHGGWRHDRAAGYLFNDNEVAVQVEYGTGPDRPQGGSSPEHATLRKALDAGR